MSPQTPSPPPRRQGQGACSGHTLKPAKEGRREGGQREGGEGRREEGEGGREGGRKGGEGGREGRGTVSIINFDTANLKVLESWFALAHKINAIQRRDGSERDKTAYGSPFIV